MMSKKWSNENLPGALHYVTANVHERRKIFACPNACVAFLEELQELRRKSECKLVAFVVMPDHIHFIANPRDGRITAWGGWLKSVAATRLISLFPEDYFRRPNGENQVWQESFKAMAMWSGWFIRQKINYIHMNPVRAKLAQSPEEYRWTSFRSFYRKDNDPLLAVDHDWWWPDDVRKLSEAMAERDAKLIEAQSKKSGRLDR